MKKNTIVGLIVVFIILIGLISLKLILFKKEAPGPEAETPQEVPKITPPKVIYNLAGTITKIEKDTLSFEATIPQVDEAGQPITKTEMRKAIIAPLTKFTRLTFVETEPGRKTPKETQISFKDLKIGDYIEVISNQDISRAEEFEITQIRALPR
ncbi:hypothetical protein AMJ49_01315 [Parcubacteria bacterium DG_74_2]|nr:MAG: hypothetical protein AMJ49_01315 [Parcubacteria bacterium DG_74_2]